MVMTSTDISAAAAAFNQQTMMRMQQSSMIGQLGAYGGAYGGNAQAASNITGGMANTGASIASPLIGGAMMLGGVDPFSMALRAGGMGSRMGLGMMGAGALGLGAAGGVGGLLMAGQYAGQQMLTGAQQRQELQGTLGQTFQFANQYGGRGFTNSDVGGISQMMRAMSSTRGPGGEFVSMGEMTQLASNMGGMGMTRGVQDARDFSNKFKEMMSAVKEIATQFSTSLSQAQEVMSSMRSSGVFRSTDAIKMSGAIRKGAVLGGLDTAEFSQMGNIGSQIARAVGGLGLTGARAGVAAMTTVAGGLRTGSLSEEAIYNSTGLTGAEGRQAYAANMMQGDARFFSGGTGRRMLASVAGQDGSLNMEAVQEYMRGNVSTGRTMELANKNLQGMGKANFIRNEGRLRAAAMEAFGGMGRVAALSNWMKGRGMDLDSMDDDRAKIFMQRQGGFSRDEVDSQLSLWRTRDARAERMEQSQEQDNFTRQREMQRRHSGLEGVKRKIEGFKKNINDKLQSIGDSMMGDAQNMVEGFINRLTGEFVGTMDRDLTPAIHSVLRGGDAGKAAGARIFGIGGKGHGLDTAATRRSMLGGQSENFSTFMSMNADSWRSAGWDISGSSSTRDALQRMQNIRGVAAASGVHDKEAAGVASKLGGSMRAQMLSGSWSGGGAGELRQFGDMLKGLASDDAGAAALYERWGQASDQERASIYGSSRTALGFSSGRDALAAPEIMNVLRGSSKFDTIQDKHRAIGKAFTGSGFTLATGRLSTDKPKHGIINPFTGEDVDLSGGPRTKDVEIGMGKYLDSERGRSAIADVMRGSDEERAATMQQLGNSMSKLRDNKGANGKNMTADDLAEYHGQQQVLIAGEYMALKSKYGDKPIPEDELAKIADNYKMPGGSSKDKGKKVLEVALKIGALDDAKKEEALQEFGKRASSQASSRVEGLTSSGVLKNGSVDDIALAGLSDAAKSVAKGWAESQQLRASMAGMTGQEIADAELKAQGLLDKADEALSHGSFKERQALLTELEKTNPEFAAISRERGHRSRLDSEEKWTKGGVGRMSAAQKYEFAGKKGGLGVTISAKDHAAVKKGTASYEDIMKRGLGLDDPEGLGLSGDQLSAANDALKRYNAGIKSGNASKIAEAETDLKRSGVVEANAKRQQENTAKANDPSYRKLEEISNFTKSMAEQMDKFVKSNGGGDEKPGE